MKSGSNGVRVGVWAFLSLSILMLVLASMLRHKPDTRSLTKESHEKEGTALIGGGSQSELSTRNHEAANTFPGSASMGREANHVTAQPPGPESAASDSALVDQLFIKAAKNDTDAVIALSKAGADGLPPLIRLTTNEHGNIRAGAINMIGLVIQSADSTFKDQSGEISAELPNIIPWLGSAVADEEIGVVLAALQLLRSLGPVSAPALPQMRAAQNHSSLHIQRAARDAASHVEHSMASPSP